ncbi:MAG: alpha/beta hydrolase [bacterium]|nr:alpha/beta hydrolase [bacterium]
MSAISFNGELVHYEVLGRGRPVLLLHGWIGSWRYWVPTMQQLQAKYRVYALDLYGFGDSGKNPARYSLEHQIALLDDFMNQLGIPKTAIIAHGLGAMIAIMFARRYPDRVPKLMVVSAPLFDSHDLDRRTPAGRKVLMTNNRAPVIPEGEEFGPSAPTAMSASAAMRAALIEAARARGGIPVPSAPPAPDDLTMNRAQILESSNSNPLQGIFMGVSVEALLSKCFKKTDTLYQKLDVDTPKTDLRALLTSAMTYDSGKMLDTMRLLPMQLVIVHGEDDPIIPVPNENVWSYITLDKEQTTLAIPLEGIRHFPMLEDDRFMRVANDFLEADDLSKVAFRDRWRRRTR